MKSELNQLAESLLFGSCDEADGCEIDSDSLTTLEANYEQFVDNIPEWIVDSLDEVYLGQGDVYEQLAHDYIMTSMGHGVGFWEKSDWEESAGEILTELCKSKGTLETYVHNETLYVY